MAEGVEFLVFGQVGIAVKRYRRLPGHGVEARGECEAHVAPCYGCGSLAEVGRGGPLAVDVAYPEAAVAGVSGQEESYLRVGGYGVDLPETAVADAYLVAEGRHQERGGGELLLGVAAGQLGVEKYGIFTPCGDVPGLGRGHTVDHRGRARDYYSRGGCGVHAGAVVDVA